MIKSLNKRPKLCSSYLPYSGTLRIISSTSHFNDLSNCASKEFVNNETNIYKSFVAKRKKQLQSIRSELQSVYNNVNNTAEANNLLYNETIGDFRYHMDSIDDNIILKRTHNTANHSDIIFNLKEDTLKAKIGGSVSFEQVKLATNQFVSLLLKDYDNNSLLLCIKDMQRNILSYLVFPTSIQIADIDICIDDDNEGFLIYVLSIVNSKQIRPSLLYRAMMPFPSVFGILGNLTKSMKVRNMYVQNKHLEMVLQENDASYFLDMTKSKDNKYIIIHHNAKNSTQISLLNAMNKHSKPYVFHRKTANVRAYLTHSVSHGFCVASNMFSHNKELALRMISFKLLEECKLQSKFPTELPIESKIWPISSSSNSSSSMEYLLDDYDIYSSTIVVYGKRFCKEYDKTSTSSMFHTSLIVALIDIHTNSLIREWDSTSLAEIIGTLPMTLSPHPNIDHLSKSARFSLSSPILPEALVEMNVLTGDIQLMSTIIDSKCTLTATCSEHTVSSSIDNHSISLVCYSNEDEDNHTKDKCKPTLLLGYGSYGICLPMSYRVDYSVLLSQGWRIAFAQVRGGGERGKSHHDSGKGMQKWNTFYDFSSCGQYLIDNGLTTAKMLCASGHSAGGLIMGVMYARYANMFAGIIMRNPFLDIFETMKDSTSDLNVHEYEEWGDCSDPQSQRGNLTESELKYIKSYSPCSLLEELSSTEKKVESLPAVMISVGLDDSRVYPGESMRWMSILRQIGDRNQLKPLFILHLQKCVGHDGSVHLEDQINDSALEICFLNEVVSVSTPTDYKYH